ncbi:MAG: 30S ribosomal protein S10 [Chlamydiota bacterium]|nr:30S ribosomal protein S10 [Chlamydiota bacterium]
MGKIVKKKIRIRLKGYDSRSLERATLDIVEAARATGSQIVGPIPLPTRRKRFTVLTSPHVDKKAREQFDLTTHSRFVDILDPTNDTLDRLKVLNLPYGVQISIKQS